MRDPVYTNQFDLDCVEHAKPIAAMPLLFPEFDQESRAAFKRLDNLTNCALTESVTWELAPQCIATCTFYCVNGVNEARKPRRIVSRIGETFALRC